ncbi:PilZ domain-containing protein [Myxococcota bacterium]|nr:PilZ domain-containing protein [Myxococcota bacterium]
MTKTYDELIGATGRSVFFRPERARVREFLSPDAQPVLRVGSVELAVFDLSMNGLSVLAPRGAPLPPVDTEADVALWMHGRAVFEGRARIARIEASSAGQRVGLALTRGFIDLPAIAREDEEAQLARALAQGGRPGRDAVGATYHDALNQVVSFVQFYRESLRRHEARYKAEGGLRGRQAIHDLEQRALAALREPWRALRIQASQAAEPLMADRSRRYAAKQLTETLLTPLLLEAPCVRRSYEKPLGYPGDYQVMLYCYNDALEGDTVFGRVFHKLWIEHPMPAGVRTRRDLVVQLALAEQDALLARDGDAAELRVGILGCGPAREVPAFVDQRPRWGGSVTWTLIDQEEEALSVAYRTAQTALARADGGGTARCLNLSFSQLLQDPQILPLARGQHLVASSGLFDYLRDTTAQPLILALYDRLAPGGLLAIGNAIAPAEDFWSPEMVLDWTLIYRTEQDMRRLGALLPESAQVEVRPEAGGAYHYLLARKPGASP